MNEITLHRIMMWTMFAFAVATAITIPIKGAWWHVATPFLFVMLGLWYRDMDIEEREKDA